VTNGRIVDFYFGVGSRYSYLASSQLERIARSTRAQFRWRPISSPDLFSEGHNPFAGSPVSRQYTAAYRAADALAWAQYYGIPFVEPRGRLEIDARLLARAAIAGDRLGMVEKISLRLMQAIYAEQRSKFGRDDIADCAAEVGFDRKAFLAALEDPQIEAERAARVEEAKARGVFGVPTFFVGTRLFFGNDRLVLVENALRASRGRDA
jgi:2-hydroxychromene-2-carboxylate isomerase